MPERDDARAELLRRWQRAAQGPEPRTEEQAPGPLSFAQERFALLESLHPGHPAHHLRGQTDVRGPLDLERYAQALQDTLQVHRGLRTRFYQDEQGRWRQQVVDLKTAPIEFIELPSGVSEVSTWLDKRLDQLSAEPFDLERAPLLRLEILRLSDEHHVLLSVVHHLAADGLALLAWGQDVAARYAAISEGAPAPLAPVCDPLDLARWQRMRQAAGLWRESQRERLEALRDLPELELPADRPRPDDGATLGARCARALDDELRRRLHGLSRQLGVTPFQTYLAAFVAELAESCEQRRFAIGTPAGGREHPATRGVIGMLGGSVAMGFQLPEHATWKEWVRAVSAQSQPALAAAEVPFEQLARQLDPTGGRGQLARHPVFQTLFNYLDFTPRALQSGAIELAYRARPSGTLFDLSLYVHDSAERGALEIEYEALRFERVTVERLLERIERRLLWAVQDPDSLRAVALPESTVEARRRLHLEGCGVDQRRWRGGLARRVEQQVSTRPDALAVAWRAGEVDCGWRYLDLWHRTRQWVAHLKKRGLTAGARVVWAPCTDGDAIALPLAMDLLGLEGCALPLEVNPDQQSLLAQQIDPQAVWLPDSRAEAWALVWPNELHIEAPAPDAELDADPFGEALLSKDSGPGANAVAYRLHTSGSTGTPKAVVVSRGALVAFLDAAVSRLGPAAAGRWLAITPPTFDIHLLERFAPLVAGGSVELVPTEVASSGERLAQHLQAVRPDVFQATPSTHRLLELAGYEGDGAAHWVIGGEPWYAGLAERAHAEAGTVWNAYGPTEATVWVSLTRLEPGDPVHLGRPLRGTAWRVASPEGAPLAIGAPGELWLRGPQLAHGYAGDEQRTASSFPEREGQRWYRTGDRVRFDSQGRLLHLGRLDDQIKLRGQRLELGAIDAALESLPEVAAAACALDPSAADGGALVALLVPTAAGEHLADAQLQSGWAAVWDHVFANAANVQAGWIDPRSGQPFDAQALESLARAFADRVLSVQADSPPKRLLEIGAGGGLIAAELASRVEGYVAQEPNVEARRHLSLLRGVEAVLGGHFGSLSAELDGCAPFDLVVLHSVVQYLGSPGALVRGLQELRPWLMPGASVVLGDLLCPAELAERPDELVFEPSQWSTWAAAEPGVESAIVLERSNSPAFDAAPDLLRERYDVVLRLDPSYALGSSGPQAKAAAPTAREVIPADPGVLLRKLAGQLPPSWMPGSWLWATDLPRNSAGKLDRRAVVGRVRSVQQVADSERPEAALSAAPSSDLGRALAQAWLEVLGSSPTPASHFFEAGGHSLSAARWVALARERTPQAAQLELGDLLRWPRFGDLLEQLEEVDESPAGAVFEHDPAELSQAQRRLVLLAALHPKSASYHLAFVQEWNAELDAEALGVAMQTLAMRHRALRVQLTRSERSGHLEWEELDTAAPLEFGGNLDESSWAEEPFALDIDGGSGLLWRVLAQSNPETQSGAKGWTLRWVLHHLIADARSVAVLAHELEALLGGRPLPALRGNFDDLNRSAARRDQRGLELAESWAREVQICAQVLVWPRELAPAGLSEPRDTKSKSRARVLHREVPAERRQALHDVAAEHGTTPHALLLALAAEWLHGLTWQTRFCIGTTLSGRDSEGLADAVGFAAATLAVPIETIEDPADSAAWIEHVSQRWARSLEHADVGFEALVRELDPERDLERPPIFQVAVDYLGGTEQASWQPTAKRGFGLREVIAGAAKLDITLQWIEQEHTQLRFEFDSARFTEAACTALADEFERRMVFWLDATEQAPPAALAIEAVPTAKDALQVPLGEQLERRALDNPEAPAWHAGDRRWTFAQLRMARVQWSAALANRGVRSGARVGVALEDPGEFALTLWSLWALGAIPVALQASDSPGRRLERYAAAHCQALISRHSTPGTQTWSPEELAESVSAPATTERWASDHEALVLFTSGTSGHPKAVRVGQAALANYLNWASSRYPLSAGAIAFTDPAFDLGLTCALGTWWTAGELHTGRGRDALERLEDVLSRPNPFGALKLTPTHLRALSATGKHLDLDGRLGCLIVGGERLAARDLAQWEALANPPQIVNEYGPTEATVAVCAATFDLQASRSSADTDGTLPIAQAPSDWIHGVAWAVVDARGASVAWGSPGELWLSGIPLADGYDDESASRRAFVDRDGRRWYRTGDRVLRTAEGWTVLGRTDAELKVRGMRADPEDLEQRLAQLPGLSRVAVALQRNLGRPLLIAFATGSGELPPATADLAELLPRGLWPDRWRRVEELPTRGHGKLDRSELESWATRELDTPNLAFADDAPLSEREEWPPHELSGLLLDLLGPEARVQLDFFANGGDSILALTASARARQLGWDLSVEALFTAGSMDLLLRSCRPIDRAPKTPNLEVRGLRATQAHYARGLTAPMGWDVQAVEVDLAQPISADLVRRALGDLVARHGALRTAYRLDYGRWTAQELPQARPLVRSAARETWNLAAPAAFEELELSAGWVFGALLDSEASVSALVLFAHHLSVDAHSWRLLLADLNELLAERELPGDQAPAASAFAPPLEVGLSSQMSSEWGLEAEAVRVKRRVSGDLLERYERLALTSALPPVDRAMAVAFGACLPQLDGKKGARRSEMCLESQGRRDPECAGAVGFFSEWLPVHFTTAQEFESDPAGALRHVVETRWRSQACTAGFTDALLNHLGRESSETGLSLSARPFEDAPLRPGHAPLRAGDELRSSWNPSGWSLEWIAAPGCNRHQVSQAIDRFLTCFESLLKDLEAQPTRALTPAAFAFEGDRQEWQPWARRFERLQEVAHLTHTQMGMLLEHLERPESQAYREQFWIELERDVDPSALESALEQLALRHSSLRSVFAWRGLQRPLRAVLPQAQVALEVLDARYVDLPQRDAQWSQRTHRGRFSPWDLESAPPWRVVLQRRADRRARLLFEYHHLLLDGWSLPTLLTDLERALSGTALLPRTTPSRFAEFRSTELEPDDEAARSYWDKSLCDFELAPRPLITPARGSSRGGVGAEHRLLRTQLSRANSREIERGARDAGATPALLTQAAWARVLQRLCGSPDVAFALTQSGRDALTANGTVGALLRTVAVRTPEAWRTADGPNDPWNSLHLEPWKAAAAERAPHEALPLARQLAALGERAGRALESLLVFENYPRGSGDDADWVAAGGFERTPYPLTWIVVPGERWTLELSASAARVSVPLQRALFEALLSELRAPALDPARWQGPTLNGPSTPPDAEAAAEDDLWRLLASEPEQELWVGPDGRRWTRGDLWLAVGQRSGGLRQQGLQPGAVVAVDLECPLERQLCLLAVWSAGAAPWTVDREDPLARRERAAILADAALWIGDRPAPGAHSPIDPEALAGAPFEAPLGAGASGPLGVLAFTSGSTGEPKALELPRAEWFSKARSLAQRYGWTGADQLLAFGAPGFDTAYEELLGSIYAGTQLNLHAQARRLGYAELENLLVEQAWTLLDLPTAYWNAWALERADAEPLGGHRLRQIVLGGQAADPHAIQAWRRRWPDVVLLNSYGPTETAVVSLAGELDAGDGTSSPISIGRPLAGVHCRVLNQSGRDDWCGELQLHDPAVRTGERSGSGRKSFKPGSAYSTGDDVLRTVDGRVHFLGRRDAQVKVRGHRVELEELEQLLGSAGYIARAAVNDAGQLVLGVLGQPDLEALGAHLQSQVPQWMRPRTIAVLGAWPLTPRGKLDRVALAIDVAAEAEQSSSGANDAPALATDDPWLSRAQSAFAQALGLDEVAPDARLELLGGDSLTALSIASRAAGHGHPPRLAALLDDPTPMGWARELARVGALGAVGTNASAADPDMRIAAGELSRAAANPAWRFEARNGQRLSGTVLITGATGLLGAHIAAEIARKDPQRSIAVLIRGASAVTAERRWKRRWSEVRGELPEGHVQVWHGDLQRPRCGWSWNLSHRRRQEVDQVVHAAADTSPTSTWAELIRANVDSTRHLVDWISGGPHIELHAVSTLGLFEGLEPPSGSPWNEQTPLSVLGRQGTPYPASKWLAEQLLSQAERMGQALVVHRPGRLLPEWNERQRDPWSAALAAWAVGSQTLLDEDLRLDARGAASVAREIAACTDAGARGEPLPRVLHLDLAQPWSLSERVQALAGRASGWAIADWEGTLAAWRPIADSRGEAPMLEALAGMVRAASNGAPVPTRVGNAASRAWLTQHSGGAVGSPPEALWAEFERFERP